MTKGYFNKIIISLILAAIILYILFRQITISDLEKILHKINLSYLLLALGAYIIINIFRTYRFYFILQKKLSVERLFDIVCVHSFLNSILPARTGELSYFYLIHKSGKVNGVENAASLLIARIFDALICAGFILFSIFFVAQSVNYIQAIATCALAGFLAIFIFFALLIFWGLRLFQLFQWLFFKLRIERLSSGKWIFNKIQEIIMLCGQARQRSMLPRLFYLSILIWLSIFSMIWLIVAGLGINLSFWQIVFISTLPIIVSVLPIQTFGGFGIYEGAMALGLALLGFDKAGAISIGFASHVIGLSFSLVLAVISYTIIVCRRD